MPWSIIKKGSQFCIQKDTDKSIVKGSCHSDKEKTNRMLAALYANEGKSMKDILFNFGGDIKSLGDNKIGGYLVRYSTAKAPDLAGEFFTKDTDFGFEDTLKTPIYLNHRLPLKTSDGKELVVKQKIGEGVLSKDDDGILIEAILYTRKQYEKVLSSLGWSSGTAKHLVDREPVGKSFHITHWPLGLDASLTPEPCDPDNICTLKSYAENLNVESAIKLIDLLDEDGDETTEGEEKVASIKSSGLSSVLTRHVDDRIDDGHDRASIIKSLARESGLDTDHIETILAGESVASVPNLKAFARVLEVSFEALKAAKQRDYSRTIKGMFEEVLADRTPSRWELDSVYSDIIRKLANTAQASAVTDVEFDLAGKVKEATEEYASRLQSHAVAQINEYVESGSDEPFYLKAIINLSNEGLETDHLDLEQHSQLVASAETGILKRFRRFYETRIKAGRVLSEKTRQRIASVRDNAMQLASDCDALLEETKPMASDSEKRAAETAFLRLQHQALQRGLNAN